MDKDTISNIKTLIKYVEYLIDFAETISNREIILDNDYENLGIEIKLFHKRLINSTIIPPSLKKELLKIGLDSVKKYSLSVLFNNLFNEDSIEDASGEYGLNIIRRKNIQDFRTRLYNMYKLIIVKS
jgi:hypothetical protein